MDENQEWEDWDFDTAPQEISNEAMAEFVGTFISAAASAEGMYRRHFCEVVANRVYDEFGAEGMCEMLIALDRRSSWISDIIFEGTDLDDIAFRKHGIYDPDLVKKARQTQAIQEMNTKLWRLRRKYARLIVEEIVADEANKEK